MANAAPESVLGKYAGGASRLLAYCVDWVVIAAIGMVSAWAVVVLLRSFYIDPADCDTLAPYPVRTFVCRELRVITPLVAAAFPTIYALFFWSTTGQTPGKRVAGLRIVRVDGKPMNVPTAVRRLVGFVISTLLLGLGFWPILIDDRRQALHDKLAGTCVLYTWRGPGDRPWHARPERRAAS